VSAVNDAPTGAVSLSGTPTEDQVLTASNTLTDADGLGPIGYQWQRNGVNIAGATASTYTPGDADVGTAISVVASYTDGYGTAESVSSAAVGPIANVNDAPVAADQTVTFPGNAPYIFQQADFGFSDVDGDSLMKIRVTAVPSNGALTLNGIDVVFNQDVLAFDIVAGNLRYAPLSGAAGTASDTLMFQVHDGTVYSTSSYTLTLNTTPVAVLLPVAPATPAPAPAPAVQQETAAPVTTNPPAASASETTVAQQNAIVPSSGRPNPDTGAAPTIPLGSEPVQQGTLLSIDGAERASATRVGSRGGPAFVLGTIVPVAPINLVQLSLGQLGTMLNSSTAESVFDVSRNQAFTEALDRLRDSLNVEAEVEQRVVASVATFGMGLSVGYVLWLLRSGILLGSLLSSLPAWRFVDPLPVLGRFRDDKDEVEDDESLESMVGTAPDKPYPTPKEERRERDDAVAR
jgi:hypothetical protein